MNELEEVQRIVAQRAADARAAQRAKDEANQLERDANAQRARDAGETLAALASYYDTAPSSVAGAIESLLPTRNLFVQPIHRMFLLQMQPGYQEPAPMNRLVIAEALHCLAGAKELPAPRADDKILGPSMAKQLRTLPAFSRVPRPELPLGMGFFETWCVTARIASPSRPDVNMESESQWVARIRFQAANRQYSDDFNENERLAALEHRLMSEKRKRLDDATDRAHHDAVESLRGAIVAVIDQHLASLPFGTAFWWTREFRRVIAREPAHLPAPTLHSHTCEAWRVMNALGIRLPFETLNQEK